MGPDAADAVRLRDLLDHARALASIAGSLVDGWRDREWAAAARSIGAMDDAARTVSPGFRQEHGEIAWGSIGGLGHAITAHSGSTAQVELRRFVDEILPDLLRHLAWIVPPQPPDDV